MKATHAVSLAATILLAFPPPVLAHSGLDILGGIFGAGCLAALLTAFPKMLTASLILPDDLRPGFGFYFGVGLSEAAIAVVSAFVGFGFGERYDDAMRTGWLIAGLVYLVLGFLLNFGLLVGTRRQKIARLSVVAILFALPFPILFWMLGWLLL